MKVENIYLHRIAVIFLFSIKNIPMAWLSTLGSSGHFDHSYVNI